MKQFILTIELGNAAMETAEHIAEALRETAERLETAWAWDMVQAEPLKIRDVNGNRVGSARVEVTR